MKTLFAGLAGLSAASFGVFLYFVPEAPPPQVAPKAVTPPPIAVPAAAATVAPSAEVVQPSLEVKLPPEEESEVESPRFSRSGFHRVKKKPVLTPDSP